MFIHVHALLCASRTRLILLRERVACYTKSAYCPILYSTIFGKGLNRAPLWNPHTGLCFKGRLTLFAYHGGLRHCQTIWSFIQRQTLCYYSQLLTRATIFLEIVTRRATNFQARFNPLKLGGNLAKYNHFHLCITLSFHTRAFGARLLISTYIPIFIILIQFIHALYNNR